MENFKAYLGEVLSISSYFALPDYLILIAIFLVILLIFLLSVAFRAHSLIAFCLFAVSGVLFFTSPFLYQYIMEAHLKKIALTLTNNAQLEYNTTYFVEGSIENQGLLDFRGCTIKVNFIPANLKAIKVIKYKLNPKHLVIERYKTPLQKGESMDFKIVIPSPNEKIAYKLHTQGACY